jgi:purine nucleosidase
VAKKYDTRKNSRREFFVRSTALAAGGLSLTDGSPSTSEARAQKSGNPAVQRIIIDTDPGVDDALAIFLALRSPQLKVEAITAVAGNVPLDLTLPNALRLVEIAGRTDVPVAAGASTPLTRQLVTAHDFHGDNGLAGVEFPSPKIRPAAESAGALIRRIVRGNPGEISIVAVGPLTNIAAVLRDDPGISRMIRRIVLMGGSFSGGNITPSAEFNMYVDPEAAQFVFGAGVPLTMVGLDVTRKVLLREEQIHKLEAGRNAASRAAAQIMRRTLDRVRKTKEGATVAMHDPLTVAHLIDPRILSLKDYFVAVETSGEMTAGETVGYSQLPIRKSAPLTNSSKRLVDAPFRPNANVAVDVNPERFFRLFLERLTGSA